MTKSQLKKYLDLKAEKEQLEQEIAEFYDSCIKSTDLDGMPGSGKISDITAALAEEAAKLHTKLRYKKHEITCALDEIEDCIARLEPRERRLMREYYINGHTWEEVCIILNYSWRQVHNIHSAILKKIA